MTSDFEKIIYSDEVIAFTTLANEYCRYIDGIALYSQCDFVDKMHRLLPLIYVKTLSIPSVEPVDPDFIEKSVTQEEWETVQQAVHQKLNKYDAYSEPLDPLQRAADSMTSLSEGFADIYQDLKDYLVLMSIGSPEMMNDAIAECVNNFREYWGQRLVNIMRVLHHLQYGGIALDTTDKYVAKPIDERPSWERNGNNHQGNYWNE